MSTLAELFPTDNNKILSGVPVKIGEATFILSYMGSSKADIFLKTRVKILSATMPLIDATMQATQELLTDLLVLGWSNVVETEDDGTKKEIEYSKETLLVLFEKYPGLDLMILHHSSDINNFRKEEATSTKGK